MIMKRLAWQDVAIALVAGLGTPLVLLALRVAIGRRTPRSATAGAAR